MKMMKTKSMMATAIGHRNPIHWPHVSHALADAQLLFSALSAHSAVNSCHRFRQKRGASSTRIVNTSSRPTSITKLSSHLLHGESQP
jgi:hypothetical protein